jgi:hypothetical protein
MRAIFTPGDRSPVCSATRIHGYLRSKYRDGEHITGPFGVVHVVTLMRLSAQGSFGGHYGHPFLTSLNGSPAVDSTASSSIQQTRGREHEGVRRRCIQR